MARLGGGFKERGVKSLRCFDSSGSQLVASERLIGLLRGGRGRLGWGVMLLEC